MKELSSWSTSTEIRKQTYQVCSSACQHQANDSENAFRIGYIAGENEEIDMYKTLERYKSPKINVMSLVRLQKAAGGTEVDMYST